MMSAAISDPVPRHTEIHAHVHVHWFVVEDSERDALADTLVRVGRVLVGSAVRSVAAAAHDVTVAQHRVLVLLSEHGTMSMSTIAQQLAVDQSTASRHCARLEALGLLVRRRAEHDGRAVDVALTGAGDRHVGSVHAARAAEIGSILDRMPDEDARAVVSALQRFDLAAREPAASGAVR